MDPKLGFEILINGTPRTFRDRKDTAYDAARGSALATCIR
jgi:hypothetical protein